MPELTTKYKLFADEYCSGKTSVQAAIAAGYSRASASAKGSQLVNRPEIQEYIARVRREQTLKAQRSTTDILQELDALAFSNMADYLDLSGDDPRIDLTTATRAQLGALNSVKTKTTRRTDARTKDVEVTTEVTVTKADKLRALELYGRQLGMFAERHEVEVVDVADRILAARQRRAITIDPEADDA